jgi:DNA-binding FrmR family transcriptional regulator
VPKKPSASHASHPAIVKRLRRAEGHLRSIIEMIQTERGCLEIAQQLHAVEKAIEQAKKTLVHDHVDHCLEQSVGRQPRDRSPLIEEFKAITRYL